MTLPLRVVLRQLKEDLIGKDSHRGVTLTYSWLANQFGHFSLGFIPTFVVYLILLNNTPAEKAITWATIGVAVAWTLFEAYNFLGPLLRKRKQHVFKPDYRNIAFDTFTDLCFFYLGGLTAHLILVYSTSVLILLLFLVVLLFFFSRYWYVIKMYVQFPEFPYQLRLSQWIFSLSDENRKLLLQFLEEDRPTHLLLFGGVGTGKTSLAVAASTELAIRGKACQYTTATKALGMFFEEDEPNNDKPWQWREVNCLIIDDLNPGHPIPEMLSPGHFWNLLTNPTCGEDNCRSFKNQKVIWVIGDQDHGGAWQSMIMDIGIAEEDIYLVQL